MSFVAILFALLLEQARPVGRGNAVHVGLRAWVRWCGRTFDAGKEHHAWLAWVFAVIVPAMAVALVYWLLATLAGWPFAVIWNIAVLYFALGFRQFSHHFTEIRDALDAGDEAQARELLARWRQVDATGLVRSDIVRQVVEHSVLSAHRHVFGVLTWFSVLAVVGLGPLGAVMYRLSEYVPRYWNVQSARRLQPVSAALRVVAERMWSWLDWVPARVTAIGFAVVGSFEDAIDSWRSYERQGSVTNDGVILASTSGAINIRLGSLQRASQVGFLHTGPLQSASNGPSHVPFSTASGNEAEVGHLRVVVGLVWRTVVMWMVLLALLSLARLLG